jgi:chromate reductase, NAD(P)H dehydrogenase (quinone)
MSAHKVGYFVGSLSSTSINRVLSAALISLAPDDLEFTEIPIGNLPLYSPDFDSDYPPEAQALKEALAASDAVLFVTPEYNRSIPGVLKNALDLASRPWGTNSFAGKPGAVIGASIGSTGSAMAQQHLRNALTYLDVSTLAQPEVFVHFKDDTLIDAEGNIANPGTQKFLQGFVDRYVAWLHQHLA